MHAQMNDIYNDLCNMAHFDILVNPFVVKTEKQESNLAKWTEKWLWQVYFIEPLLSPPTVGVWATYLCRVSCVIMKHRLRVSAQTENLMSWCSKSNTVGEMGDPMFLMFQMLFDNHVSHPVFKEAHFYKCAATELKTIPVVYSWPKH